VNAEKDFRPVTRVEDLATDLAATHRAVPPGEAPAETEALVAQLDEHGYVVLPDLIDDTGLAAIRHAVDPLLGPMGRNSFEGNSTQRAYSVLNKTRALDEVVEHPSVLAILDRLLMPNYLLSQLQVINIHPGERAQLAHPDDGFYPIPRPRAVLSLATIWAIDEFTATNGATVVIPGSHRWGDGRTPQSSDVRTPVEMSAGSCVLFVGSLWHGGGANRHERPRMAVTAQYCQPWLRPQEAFTLSTTHDTVRALSPKLRAMLGYGIHPPFMGSVDGMHPLRLLD
jgi:ectoine hydroxylase-related dioxygenase (phytanoyl-CoA dioxygenase family)